MGSGILKIRKPKEAKEMAVTLKDIIGLAKELPEGIRGDIRIRDCALA
jgi:hypothetical protein